MKRTLKTSILLMLIMLLPMTSTLAQAKNKNKITEISRVHLVLGGGNPKISACAGGPRASLAYADKTFTSYLDLNFKSWKLDNIQPATTEAEAEVWEIVCEMNTKGVTLNKIFNSFDVNLGNLKWDSQEQIEKFCIENQSWLRTDDYGTLFLFSEKVDDKEKFFVAHVVFGAYGRLRLDVSRLSGARLWYVLGQQRVVVPATWRSIPKN